MRDHELELIAALAEGSLEDETEARALLDSSPEARAEYEAQQSALDALSDAAPVVMTETDRAALHRDVWTELRAPAAAAKASTPWFYRWSTVAAGLFVVVGVVAVINQTGTLSGDDASEPAVGETSQFTADGGVDTAETTIAEDAAVEEGTDSTEAAAERDSDGEVEDAQTGADEMAPLSAETRDFYTEEAAKVREMSFDDPAVQVFEEGQVPPEIEECLAAAGLDAHTVVAAVTSITSGEEAASEYIPAGAVPYIATVPSGADLADAIVTFLDENCSVITQVEE